MFNARATTYLYAGKNDDISKGASRKKSLLNAYAARK